jgi:hypothetical protein
MTSVNYYYIVDERGQEHTVDAPGELCDFCGKLSTISKEGTLIKVSMPSPILEEYGKSGDLHAHKECLQEAIKEYEEMIRVWRKDLSA